MAGSVSLEFLDGEALELPVLDVEYVRDLLRRAHAAKPPPKAASLQLLSEEALLKPWEPAAPLAGKTVKAVYGPQLSYLVARDGEVAVVDECHEEWDEATACKTQVPEENWVPAPDAVGPVELRNLAKEAEGVALTATGNFCREHQKLLNLLRLGSKVGEPLYVPEKPMAVRGGSDGSPKLILDFGRVVMLQRVGASCSCADRFRDWFQAWSTAEEEAADETWESWGSDTASCSPGNVFFLDRPPTRVRRLRVTASSGRVPGGRVQHLFAYGFEELGAAGGKSSDEPAPTASA